MMSEGFRSALVTGAASGIGRAVAARLVEDGARVLSVDLEPDPDGPGEPLKADLSTREGNKSAVEAALDAFGSLDSVVANAGFQHVSPVAEFPEDKWDSLISILLTSPFLLARYSWDALKNSGHGRFIAIASAHALVASPSRLVTSPQSTAFWGSSRHWRWRGPRMASRPLRCALRSCVPLSSRVR
jgi:3-hydroxybutyrate dehydrogenase